MELTVLILAIGLLIALACRTSLEKTRTLVQQGIEEIRLAKSVEPSPTKDSRWEYLVVTPFWRKDLVRFVYHVAGSGSETSDSLTNRIRPDQDADSVLDVLGRNGWELVSVVVDKSDDEGKTTRETTFYFKRPRGFE